MSDGVGSAEPPVPAPPSREPAPQPIAGWLAEPARLLAVAQQPEQPLRRRLAALAEMGSLVDRLFTDDLPLARRAAGAESRALGNYIEALPGRAGSLLAEGADTLLRHLLPALACRGIRVAAPDELSTAQQRWLRSYFLTHVYPLLTPLAVDSGHPFPYISSGSLNLLVRASQTLEQSWVVMRHYARVKVPASVPRLVLTPTRREERRLAAPTQCPGRLAQTFVWGEELVRCFVERLFPGVPVSGAYLFRVLRDGPAVVRAQAAGLARRRSGSVVRVDVEDAMPLPVLDWLLDQLDAPAGMAVRVPRPLALADLADLAGRLPAPPAHPD